MVPNGNQKVAHHHAMDQEIILEKDQTIQQLKETIEILELKVKKLEQLVKLKDAKILNLSNKLQTAGIMQ
jgi:predicted RNase H-like nuclease (RuvC/YqgF family)